MKLKKEKTRYGWSVIFTYLIGTGDSGMYTTVRKDCLFCCRVPADICGCICTVPTLPDRTVCMYVYIRYVYIYPMSWRDQYHHIHCPLSSTHTAIRADPVFRECFLINCLFPTLTMASCRSRRSFLTTRLCTYMYSLRKCTVVSCNAACLSWFLWMGWDVELRRWDDLCCYP